MLIDFHTHVYPEKIAQKGVQYIGDFYDLPMSEKGTLVHLKSVAKASGTTHVVLLGVAVKPEVVESINRFTASMLDEFTFGFGTIHPDFPNKKEEICHCLEMGLKGIKIHPDMQKFNIDDPRMMEVYELLSKKGAPIMIHMGDDRHDHSHPARLRRVLQMFPQLQVCAAHFGGHTMYETARENLSDTSCIMDISSTLMFMEKEQAERYINHYGAERLAFGTDYPIWDPVREVRRFLSLNITEEQKEQIAHKTAERFLEL